MKKFLLLLPVLLATALEAQPGAPAAPSGGETNDLSRQATDPTASLMAMNLQGIYTGDYHGAGFPGQPDDNWTLQFRPVIPFQFLDHPNILRATIPFQIDGRGDEGFGPVSAFDLLVFNESWGRWGLGPLLNFDTTGDLPDEFAFGPAVGGVWQVNEKLSLGLFSQNLFANNTAVTSIQPVIAYQLGDGWSISAGDLQCTYDWEAGRWLSLPVGFQIGKVTRIGEQPVRFALNPQYNLQNDRGLSEWSITFTFTALFPTF